MISADKPVFARAFWVVVIAAAGLRLAGIGFGLPDLFHQDEPILVNHALAIGARGWNPHFFILPPFCMYLLFLIYAVGFVVLKITYQVPDAASYAALFLKDPTAFYLAARIVLGVLFGTAAVWLIGRRAGTVFSKSTGLLAAFFLAFLPLHVRHSHYAYTDAAVTFALTLFWLELIRLARKEGGWGAYVRAGAALGWAVSVKYTAAYTAPVFLIAWALREGGRMNTRRAWVGMLIFAGVSLGTFAVIAPYTFLDWNTFWAQICHQAGAEVPLPFFHHLRYSLAGGAGPAFLILAGAGLAALLVGRSKEGWITAAFVGIFYTVNSVFGQPFARYVLPLTPILCVTAAVAWETFFRPRGRAMQLLALMLVLVFFIPVTVWSDGLFLQPDTRTLCREWFEENAPGSRIVLSSGTFGPRLPRTAEQIQQMAVSEPLREERKRLELEIAKTRNGYTVFALSDSKHLIIQADAQAVRATNPDYLVVDRLRLSPEGEKLLKDLTGAVERVKTFSPYRDSSRKKSTDPHDSTAAPDLSGELFARKSLGPYLEVYRFKKVGQGE